MGRTGHIQIADYPGRREPGTGAIDFHRLFRLLDRAGYSGWVGCEYFPAGDTREGLVWRETYARTDAPPVESES
jgi:hydroxypyruvate isomerase